MKNLKLTLVYIFILASSLVFSQSQSKKSSSIKQVHELSSAYIKALEEEGFEILRIEEDLIFNQAKLSLRVLQKGVTYLVAAFGTSRVKDIDLTINKFDKTSEKFVKVDSDKKEEKFAMIKIIPEKASTYQFSIKVYEFNNSYDSAHYGLIVMRKN